MKEVFTKSFWQGVKKTFYTALKAPPAEDRPAETMQMKMCSQPPTEGDPNDSPPSEMTSAKSATSE